MTLFLNFLLIILSNNALNEANDIFYRSSLNHGPQNKNEVSFTSCFFKTKQAKNEFNSVKKTAFSECNNQYNQKLNTYHTRLLISSETIENGTDFYFVPSASNGLDPGYDAMAIFNNPSTPAIYSYLVEQDQGIPMAVQALHENALENVSVPLGVHAIADESITFTINNENMPEGINIYLEDTELNVLTLLNSDSYTVIPNENLVGTRRFVLTFLSSETLSLENNKENSIRLFTNTVDNSIRIEGKFYTPTEAFIYNLQGKILASIKLERSYSTHVIYPKTSYTGAYLVQIKNRYQSQTFKILLN